MNRATPDEEMPVLLLEGGTLNLVLVPQLGLLLSPAGRQDASRGIEQLAPAHPGLTENVCSLAPMAF